MHISWPAHNSIHIHTRPHIHAYTDARVVFIEEDETVKLRFPSELPAGEATIDIAYTGTINNQMKGFYRTKYTHPDHPNEERYAAVTQFEVGNERRQLFRSKSLYIACRLRNLFVMHVSYYIYTLRINANALTYCSPPYSLLTPDEPSPAGMSQLTRPPLMSLSLCQGTGWPSLIW